MWEPSPHDLAFMSAAVYEEAAGKVIFDPLIFGALCQIDSVGIKDF